MCLLLACTCLAIWWPASIEQGTMVCCDVGGDFVLCCLGPDLLYVIFSYLNTSPKSHKPLLLKLFVSLFHSLANRHSKKTHLSLWVFSVHLHQSYPLYPQPKSTLLPGATSARVYMFPMVLTSVAWHITFWIAEEVELAAEVQDHSSFIQLWMRLNSQSKFTSHVFMCHVYLVYLWFLK